MFLFSYFEYVLWNNSILVFMDKKGCQKTRTYVEENESTIWDNNKINTFDILNDVIVIEKLTACWKKFSKVCIALPNSIKKCTWLNTQRKTLWYVSCYSLKTCLSLPRQTVTMFSSILVIQRIQQNYWFVFILLFLCIIIAKEGKIIYQAAAMYFTVSDIHHAFK